jgi:hypothetical protein
MAEMMEKVKDYITSANIKRPLPMEKLSEFLAVERAARDFTRRRFSKCATPTC